MPSRAERHAELSTPLPPHLCFTPFTIFICFTQPFVYYVLYRHTDTLILPSYAFAPRFHLRAGFHLLRYETRQFHTPRDDGARRGAKRAAPLQICHSGAALMRRREMLAV